MTPEIKTQVHAHYLQYVNMGHPTQFALDRVSARWGLTLDATREIVAEYSAEATRVAAQRIHDAREHLREQARIDRARQERLRRQSRPGSN